MGWGFPKTHTGWGGKRKKRRSAGTGGKGGGEPGGKRKKTKKKPPSNTDKGKIKKERPRYRRSHKVTQTTGQHTLELGWVTGFFFHKKHSVKRRGGKAKQKGAKTKNKKKPQYKWGEKQGFQTIITGKKGRETRGTNSKRKRV